MKSYLWIMLFVAQGCQGFLVRTDRPSSVVWQLDAGPTIRSRNDDRGRILPRLHMSTPEKPLYDATNYTFPDTTTPDGIAEALEVSFVHACMQLRSGYVDVLKLFIAAAMSSYQFGFSIDKIEKALLDCPNESANRPLMAEEVELRHTWYSLAYLTLLAIDHSTTQKDVVEASIPDDINDKYGLIVERMAEIYKSDDRTTLSVDELMKDPSVAPNTEGLSETERAVLLQSMRVATLTLVVLREALEAGPGGQSPPTPPIKGAFE